MASASSLFVRLKRLSYLLHVSSMHTNRFMQLLTGHTKLLGPVMNIGGKFRIDLVRVVWPLAFGRFLFVRICSFV